jgi:hypothetical protein
LQQTASAAQVPDRKGEAAGMIDGNRAQFRDRVARVNMSVVGAHRNTPAIGRCARKSRLSFRAGDVRVRHHAFGGCTGGVKPVFTRSL